MGSFGAQVGRAEGCLGEKLFRQNGSLSGRGFCISSIGDAVGEGAIIITLGGVNVIIDGVS